MFLLNVRHEYVQELEKFISISVLKWSEITLLTRNLECGAAQR